MKQKADIGLIGLAVMGENLVLNMESKGFTADLSLKKHRIEPVWTWLNFPLHRKNLEVRYK